MLVLMKISLSTQLNASLEEVWAALHDPGVFQSVSAPFLRFRAEAQDGFPERWESGKTYVVRASALGLLPLGTQEINPVTSSEGMRRQFRDNGRGLTGALAAVSSFQHTMTLEPSGVGPTTLHDTLEFSAGALTPLMWLGFRVFWSLRHAAMRSLASQWRSAEAARWDSRYTGSAMWSGKPNAALERAVEGLTPSHALEVGAGEGADALWLAEQGWNVTATDLSLAALTRGEAERQSRVTRDHHPRMIRWVTLDAVNDSLPTPPEKYDLVTNFFGHGPREMRKGLWAAMAGVVAPGGRLVIVGHSPSDVAAGVQRPPEDMMFDTQELTDFFAPLGDVLTAEEWNRQQTGPLDQPVTVADVVAIVQF